MNLHADCKLGVCMTCPAKMISGTIDQSGAMLSKDVTAQGYALLCMAMPTSDCKIATILEVCLFSYAYPGLSCVPSSHQRVYTLA